MTSIPVPLSSLSVSLLASPRSHASVLVSVLVLLVASNLKFAFVLVCLNRFQQITTVHTFQAANEATKVSLS